MKKGKIATAFLIALGMLGLSVNSSEPSSYWIKIKADNAIERTKIANTGVSIEIIKPDFVIATGSAEDLKRAQATGLVENFYSLSGTLDFPQEDREYHNYERVTNVLNDMVAKYPRITKLINIGQTLQGRPILGVRISDQLDQAGSKPGIFFVGGHHAREHLSVEIPLRFLQYFLAEYERGNTRIINLVKSRDIHIVPAMNADGLEYDVETGSYKYWRKNRRQNSNGSYGVDLNRNYGFKWGTGGSSSSPNSDVFMGPTPFSEPETQAIKNYIESNKNLTIVLSFHTFSELILYPWGHKYDGISEPRDRQVHEVMARTMAQWNNYRPQQASQLYIASGDLMDWAYGSAKLIAFTFELDPADQWSGGGFYPGPGVIPNVLQKNIEPCLYLIEHADNPYRVLQAHPYKAL